MRSHSVCLHTRNPCTCNEVSTGTPTKGGPPNSELKPGPPSCPRPELFTLGFHRLVRPGQRKDATSSAYVAQALRRSVAPSSASSVLRLGSHFGHKQSRIARTTCLFFSIVSWVPSSPENFALFPLNFCGQWTSATSSLPIRTP